MANSQDDQQAGDDQSTATAPDSDQQSSETKVKDESADQATDVPVQGDQPTDAQPTADAGAPGADPNCAGWFSGDESASKRAAEFYVKNELTGDRGVVENIEVADRDDPESYSCTVHCADKKANLEVVVFPKEITVREALPDISDRLTCWYDYKCPLPNRDVLLTKRNCKMMALSSLDYYHD